MSIMGLSPSTNFVAAKRMGTPAASAWSSTMCASEWMQRCTAPEQKSCRLGSIFSCAARSACSISSSMPSFFAAEMGTTGTPSSSSSLFTSTVLPLARISSIMFSAMTMGRFSSMSCMER